jgi:hypothetical protein
MDGTQCGLGGNGQCWQGECADGEAQCRQLWGQGGIPKQMVEGQLYIDD